MLDQAFATLATEAGLDPEQVALVREVTEVCRLRTPPTTRRGSWPR